MRLASGLAQAVNFMLGIYAEPPLDCMVGLRSIGRNYICIYIYTIYVYIYICIHTDTRHIPPPPTTTTPHMLVTGTRIKRDNKTHSQSSKP